MPALLAFNRRWNIGSDDFVFPAVTEAFFRTLWTCLTVLMFSLSVVYRCEKSQKWPFNLTMSFSLSLLINLICLFWCMMLAIESSKGSILDVKLRECVRTLLYIRLPLLLLEIADATFSIWTISKNWSDYAKPCRILLAIYTSVSWILVLSVILGMVFMFNPMAMLHVDLNSSNANRSHWARRLRWFNLFADKEMRKAIDDIAALVVQFFRGSDLVFTDIVAGLLLVAHSPHQTVPVEAEEEAPIVEWMKIPENFCELERIYGYAHAIYGWPFYCFGNCDCIAWCRLFTSILKIGRCCNKILKPIGDNCCWGNTAAFILTSKCDESDIIYISFRNRLYQSPFIVVLDHKISSVIVAIRGSFSLEDAFTDLMLNDATFSVDVDVDDVLQKDKELDENGDVRVHFGMFKNARNIYDVLQKTKTLDELFSKYRDYKLVITGHSLGAGVAALLALLYKKTYSDLRCYAYSPPGCVINQNGIKESEKYILSVIVGDDIVPRASYQSLYRLKLAIDKEIRRTNLPKYKILAKGLYRLLLKKPCNFGTASTIPYHLSYMRQEDEELNLVQLYPPGKLLHLNQGGLKVIAHWVKHEFFKDIQLTANLISDHVPMNVHIVLRRITEVEENR